MFLSKLKRRLAENHRLIFFGVVCAVGWLFGGVSVFVRASTLDCPTGPCECESVMSKCEQLVDLLERDLAECEAAKVSP